jgi:hypothetical protein
MPRNYVVNTAQKITQRSGSYTGKGMLTAELLVGFLIVLIRIVADFDSSTGKGNVLHPQGQYGPMPITAALILTFFMLSLLAMGGGTRAKIAVIFGATVVIALGLNSVTEFQTVSSTIGNIGQITVPAPSGTEGSGASNTSQSLSALGILGNQQVTPAPVANGTGPIGSPTNPAPTPTGSLPPSLGTLANLPPGRPGSGTMHPGTTPSDNNPPGLGQFSIPGITPWVREHTPGWLGGLL